MDRIENIKRVIGYLLAGKDFGRQIPSSLIDCQRLMRAGMNVWSDESIQACLEGRGATNEDEVNVWEPKPVSQDILDAQDAELTLQRQDKGVVSIEGQGLQLWQGDITRLKVDAIVNAANAQALGCWSPLHNCIDNFIHSAAGIQLRKECADIMQGRLLDTGKAFITQGYNLPARHVIHTVGPIIESGSPSDEQQEHLAQCYRSCLDLAERNGLESIAFCCISTGVFHFPNELAARIAVQTVKAYPRKSVKTVIFNVFLDKDYDIYSKLL